MAEMMVTCSFTHELLQLINLVFVAVRYAG